MTLLEELASIVVRIRELKARIDSAEDKDIAWLDELELIELRGRLEKMRDALYTKERR
jgi:hypothetical protein